MSDIASNPVRKVKLGSMLQASRERRLERQAEKQKGKLGEIVKKQLDKERKVTKEKREEFIPRFSEIKTRHNNTIEVYQEIAEEVFAKDKWAKSINDMTLKILQKSLLKRTVILWSRREDKTLVGLGCSEEDKLILLSHKTQIQEAMSSLSGRIVEVEFIVTEDLSRAPLQLEQAIFNRRQAEAKNALEMDSNLQMLMSEFGAEIDSETIIPMPYKQVVL